MRKEKEVLKPIIHFKLDQRMLCDVLDTCNFLRLNGAAKLADALELKSQRAMDKFKDDELRKEAANWQFAYTLKDDKLKPKTNWFMRLLSGVSPTNTQNTTQTIISKE